MTNVIGMFSYVLKKKAVKKKIEKDPKYTANNQDYYTGKLGEAMAKYGSATGNVMKEQFKDKELNTEKDNDDDF